MRYAAIAVDYGGTITCPDAPVDPELRQRRVDPRAATALHILHSCGHRLVLVSNNRPDQDRGRALQLAGLQDVFATLVLSQELGVGKPHPAFYRAALDACDVPAEQVLWVGNNVVNDVLGPLAHNVGAAVLIGRPPKGAVLPERVTALDHVAGLPRLLAVSH
ncbi:HAD family hydrolase [Nonomuraea turkmeniaca]|uniref:HAD family hydrolase n=1 Tax=Nonomuraea turkmeniaca TaxID=103838 RepID=A0A5S4EZ71_9ACTN|nr:HAD family hydrolase [Nonomuraea turkmeniaca]TMR08889.1 HAD family hydrolase [Nonomuraea turkmeniaca]